MLFPPAFEMPGNEILYFDLLTAIGNPGSFNLISSGTNNNKKYI